MKWSLAMPSKKHVLDKIRGLLPGLQEDQRAELLRYVQTEQQIEISRPPMIAIIGPTGVGKSSTINALFKTDLPVHDAIPGTLSPTKLTVQPETVFGEKGEIILYDMPGIGQDIDDDDNYKKMYTQILAQCDVAVWILSANERRIKEDQEVIRDVVAKANNDIVERLVIGMNKVDLLEPGHWDDRINLPSKRQEETMRERITYVQMRLTKVCPGLTTDRIIAYSAKKQYQLRDLFQAMMRACVIERAWVLKSREDITDPLDLVDAKLRNSLNR